MTVWMHLAGLSTQRRAACAAGLLMCAVPAAAQIGPEARQDGIAGAGKRTVSVDAAMTAEVEWTSNGLGTGGGAGGGGDFIITARPSVRLAANGSRLKGQVDYSLSRYQNFRDDSRSRTQNDLRANGQLEVIENFAFVDVIGLISQQSISAFGPQSGSDAVYNPNRTEVSTFRVSPYVRGLLGQWASYTARYSRTMQHSGSNAGNLGNQTADEIIAQLQGVSGLTALNWSVDLSRQDIDYDTGVGYRSDRLRASIGYPVTSQLTLSVIPGRESNNFISPEMESYNTFGARLTWRPSVRTNFGALIEKRFFGRAYQVDFEYRTPRTAWRFSDSRDVSAAPNLSGALSLGPLYDILFLQFASVQPDPVLRAQLVESYMQANGLDRNSQVRLGFLSSSASVMQRRDLSFTLLGLRDSMSFLATQSRSSRLSQFTTIADDFADSAVIRQRGLSMLYSHRLTPDTSWSATVSHVRTDGQQSSQHSTLRSLNVSLSTRLSPRTSASVGLRRSVYDNDTSPYSESAVRAGVSIQF